MCGRPSPRPVRRARRPGRRTGSRCAGRPPHAASVRRPHPGAARRIGRRRGARLLRDAARRRRRRNGRSVIETWSDHCSASALASSRRVMRRARRGSARAAAPSSPARRPPSRAASSLAKPSSRRMSPILAYPGLVSFAGAALMTTCPALESAVRTATAAGTLAQRLQGPHGSLSASNGLPAPRSRTPYRAERAYAPTPREAVAASGRVACVVRHAARKVGAEGRSESTVVRLRLAETFVIARESARLVGRRPRRASPRRPRGPW